MSEQSELEDSKDSKAKHVWQPEKPSDSSRLYLAFAIIGIALVLGAILVPNYFRAQARSSMTACKSNVKNIGTAIEMYVEDHKGANPSELAQLTPNYLKSLPECPAAGYANYVLSVGKDAPMNSTGDAQYYFIACKGENHTGVAITGDYPAYSAAQGLIERAP